MASSTSFDRNTAPKSSHRSRSGEETVTNLTEPFQALQVSSENNGSNSMVEGLAKKLMNTLNVSFSSRTEYEKKLADVICDLRHAGISDTKYEENLTAVTSDLKNSKLSKSPTRSSSRRGRSPMRRHRSRSRTLIGVSVRKGVDCLRKFRSRSPLPPSKASSFETVATEADGEKFYDAASSPAPQRTAKQSTQSGSNGRPPTPTSASRPPLASVNTTDTRTQNENVPSMQSEESTFKFNRDSANFSIGSSSPNNKIKIGSPSKRSMRSPNPRASPAHSNQEFVISPLSVSGSEFGNTINPSPRKLSSQTKPCTSASPLLPSPIPDQFHHLDTLNSTSRFQPNPHTINGYGIVTGAASRRQTAPSNMASAATTADTTFMNTYVDPKTPLNMPLGSTSTVPSTAPDTAEPFINKKIRNTATPPVVFNTTKTMFNVDLKNINNLKTKGKGKGKRGGILRRGLVDTSSSANIVNDMNTDKTPHTAKEMLGDHNSPSNGSTVSMDTSPFFSPPPQQRQQSIPQPMNNSADGQQQAHDGEFSQGFSTHAQFNLGVGDNQPAIASKVKVRSKRKDNGVRRQQYQRSQSVQIANSSRSSSDLNHNQVYQENLSKKRLEITALREEGRSYYTNENYRDSTRIYTEAIRRYKSELFSHVRGTHHLLALLLSNRAAALLMIGAYEGAIGDCRNGIIYAIDPRDSNPDLMSVDANPALWPKLHIRMARSYMKLGKVDEADRAFTEADESATIVQKLQSGFNITNVKEGLEQTETDATLGRTDVSRLRIVLEKSNILFDHMNTKTKVDRDEAIEALRHVKIALSIASGCYDLHQMKIKLLSDLKRWREVASHCERFAASNVKFDGCLIGDLSSKNPFPDVAIAKHLTADFFGDTREDELNGAEMKLDRKTSPDAVFRLPFPMMPYYLRSLRLEERYYNSENCIDKLGQFLSERASVVGQSIYTRFSWLSEERDKLHRTKTEREQADHLFQNAEYEKAGKKYAVCLLIDSVSSGSSYQFPSDGCSCAGGRLHAVLYCNRAACFMAVKRYDEALSECTAALRIYPRYLKAILRRSRCYSRLNRTREAETDLKRWLEIVQQGRKNTTDMFLSACIFDGPRTVKVGEEKDIQAELDDLLKNKARAKAEERTRNSYREQSQSWKSKSEKFHFTNSSDNSQSPASDARRRREYFYNSQSSSRRWDSSKDRGSKSRSDKANSRTGNKNNKNDYGNNNRGSSRTRASKNCPMKVTNHYTALGLNWTATSEEIKKTYRKMAVKHHPDKNIGDPKAAENFCRIKDAYEILNDPKLRRKYDSER